MKTSHFVKQFRSLCDELEKINANEDGNVFKQDLLDVATRWDMEELNELVQG